MPRVSFATASYKLGKFPLAAKLGVGLQFFLLRVELSMRSSSLPSRLQLWRPSAGLISSVPFGVVFQLSECRLATLPRLTDLM